MTELTLVLSFLAGLVSFLSPCVIPIVPGFLSYLTGASVSDPATKRKDIFLSSLFFVLGFSMVFSAFGVLLNTLLENVAYDAQIWLSRVGGILIIFFGLYLTGLLPIPLLNREFKFGKNLRFHSRHFTAFVFGAAFAAGWTPCVGPVLGGILGLAATQPTSALGLLFSYSLGLGLPFLGVGLFASSFTKFIAGKGKIFHYITIGFGIVLIFLGILVFTQNLNRIANLEILNRLLLSE